MRLNISANSAKKVSKNPRVVRKDPVQKTIRTGVVLWVISQKAPL